MSYKKSINENIKKYITNFTSYYNLGINCIYFKTDLYLAMQEINNNISNDKIDWLLQACFSSNEKLTGLTQYRCKLNSQ